MTDNFNIDQLAKFSPEERRDYEESMKNFRDLYASLETKYNKGAKDGEARGLKKGREEERAKAHQKALRSAFTLFALGTMSVEQIALIMDLDVNELNEYIKANSSKA